MHSYLFFTNLRISFPLFSLYQSSDFILINFFIFDFDSLSSYSALIHSMFLSSKPKFAHSKSRIPVISNVFGFTNILPYLYIIYLF